MNRKLFLAMIVLATALGACKKSNNADESPKTNPIPVNVEANKWTFKGTTYTHVINSAVWNGSGTSNGLMGSGSNETIIAFQIWFYSRTPATGAYKIMSFTDKLLSSDQNVVSVNAAIGSVAYRSKTNGGTVNVTNTNGVISASVKDVELVMDGAGEIEKITGNLTFTP